MVAMTEKVMQTERINAPNIQCNKKVIQRAIHDDFTILDSTRMITNNWAKEVWDGF